MAVGQYILVGVSRDTWHGTWHVGMYVLSANHMVSTYLSFLSGKKNSNTQYIGQEYDAMERDESLALWMEWCKK